MYPKIIRANCTCSEDDKVYDGYTYFIFDPIKGWYTNPVTIFNNKLGNFNSSGIYSIADLLIYTRTKKSRKEFGIKYFDRLEDDPDYLAAIF